MQLWYQEKGPKHHRSLDANETLLWVPSDTKELYIENRKDPEKSRLLDELGWTEDSIIYDYNHQGFRCEQFDDRPAGLAIGCSLTEGVGIKLEQAWPSILSEMLGIHIWNLGIGGTSAASNFRILLHYLPILKPRFVVHCIPSKYRFDYTDRTYQLTITPMDLGPFKELREFCKIWFSNDANSDFYSLAHVMAIRCLCYENHIPYFGIESDTFTFDKKARDLAHPGAAAQAKFAQDMYELISTQGGINGIK